MERPRLFLSAVSDELRTVRKEVAATVHRLGFDPVSQDDFPTGYGELRQWLRKQIDSCAGLIQLIGHGYGAEPPDVDPEYGRISYTQFEFLYARDRKKKTWVIVVGEGCNRDKPPGKLDLPREAAHPDPQGYQAERRKLQQDYIARLKAENHLRHTANNKTEMENIILRLRDDLGELRKQWEDWLKEDASFKAAMLDERAAAARLTTEKIRAYLLQTIEETHGRELAEAEAASDWRKRQLLREAAQTAHTARLSRIEELAASFAEIEGRGTATSVFQEMTRILTEQGVDEAISYVGTQRSSILKTVHDRAKAAHERNRAELQPLLQAAALQEARGEADEARALYADILDAEPDWLEALNASFWFHADQGDIASIHSTVDDAWRNYKEAHRIALLLTATDPGNTEWQRDLSISHERLGDVARERGNLKEAAQDYRDGLEICMNLVAIDRTNTDWQCDLSVFHERLGEIARARGNLEEAARAYRDSLGIRKGLVAADPGNNEWQRDLSVSHGRLGDVAMEEGNLEEAARAYGNSLKICKDLVAADPGKAKWQRALAVSHERLSNVAKKKAIWSRPRGPSPTAWRL
jgi:tetratricopeptide (TPR) repeat protein